MEGWTKLYRKLLYNPIFRKAELLQMFIYCLLRANHEPNKLLFNGELLTINEGQFITGRTELSKDLGSKESITYKRVRLLEKMEFINIKSNNKFSIITVVNWASYQISDEISNSKGNNEVTTKEQQSNTDKNDKNDNKIQNTIELLHKEPKNIKQQKKVNTQIQVPENIFLEFAKSEYEKIGKEFSEYEYSVRAKYESWANAGWKDGNGEQIKNWKSKFKNTLPYLKAIKIIPIPQKTESLQGNSDFENYKQRSQELGKTI